MNALLRSVARQSRDGIVEAVLSWGPRDRDQTFVSRLISSILQERNTQRAPVVDRWLHPTMTPRAARPVDVFRMVSFLSKNKDSINQVADLLDDKSQSVLASIYAYHALGPAHVAFPESAEILACYAEAQRFKIGGSEIDVPPFEASRFRVPFEGRQIDVECWLGNVVYTFLRRQYYFQRGPVSIMPRQGDVVIDAGACFGDTALAFAATVGPEGRVHSFEPMPRQLEILKRNLGRNPELSSRISLHQYALSSASGQKLKFADAGAAARASDGNGVEVVTKRLDDMIGREIERVDYIKMDIEGAELSALEGAADTIRRFRPRLGISVYHSLSDYFEIPKTLSRLCPDYVFHLEHYTIHEPETVLYAAPK